jgi:hypothetical protein
VAVKRFDGALFPREGGDVAWSGERIYLGFHREVPGPRRCAVSGKDFTLRARLGFFVELEEDRPVAPSTALSRGFTMRREDFQKLEELLELEARGRGAHA